MEHGRQSVALQLGPREKQFEPKRNSYISKGPMDHARCIEFWGREAEACGEFPK
jgi:hypothetical protein